MKIINKIKTIKKEKFLTYTIAFFARGFSALSAFLMTIVISRYLNSYEAGIYFLTFSILTIMSIVGRLGLDNTVTRYIAIYSSKKQWFEVSYIMNKAIKVVTIFLLFILFILIIFNDLISRTFFLKYNISMQLLWITPSILFLGLSTILSYGLAGLKKPTQSIFVLNILISVLIITSFFIFNIDTSLQAIKILSLVTALNLVFTIFLWKKNTKFKKTINSSFDISLWKSCLPLWAVAIMTTFTQLIGQFNVAYFTSSEEVAYFFTAQRTALLISLILITFNTILAPKFAHLYNLNKLKEIKELTFNSLKIMMSITIPISIIMFFYATEIMLIFGSEYIQGAKLLQIIAFGQLFNVFSGSASYLLMMTGHERDLRNLMIINGVFTISLSIILTYFFGVVGAAWALSISLITQNIMSVYIIKQRLNFNIYTLWFNKKNKE